jgi:hypothetical protein
MSLRKRDKLEYPQVISTYNETNPLNPSHLVNTDGSFFLRNLTLENIDQSVFNTFNRRFKIAGKELGLILLDAEVASLRFDNPQNFDTFKQYLNLPYFTMWRSNVSPITRTSPTNRPTIYVVPTMKPQGVVYTEYIMPPPQLLKALYTFKFVTTYREYLNQLETYFLEYFKNKRNIVIWDNERFEIMPADQFSGGSLEVVDREGADGQSLYVVTYEVQVIAYTRDISQILKRERPNTYSLQIVERDKSTLDSIYHTETRLPQEGI